MRPLPLCVSFARRAVHRAGRRLAWRAMPCVVAAAVLALGVLLPLPAGSAANAESGAHRNPPPPPAVTVPDTTDLR